MIRDDDYKAHKHKRISQMMRSHYSKTFEDHGATSQGVDWGLNTDRMFLRYGKMLDVITSEFRSRQAPCPSLLDVGCGYSGLADFAEQQQIDLDYTGIDIAENMISWIQAHHPKRTVFCGDVLTYPLERSFNFIVCSGILTQKLTAHDEDMIDYATALIERIYSLSTHGVAFNVMTSHVNYKADNLFYRDPVELLQWCLANITKHVRLDHDYGLYEYTVYLYKRPA